MADAKDRRIEMQDVQSSPAKQSEDQRSVVPNEDAATNGPVSLDEIALVRLEPGTWHTFLNFQIDVLQSHVGELEDDIAKSITDYQNKRTVSDTIEVEDGIHLAILEEHRGVESTPNDLEDIFEYYFPNLRRRSTLLILFSFLERQLDQLCELFASELDLKIAHTDLRDKGIDRSRRYLKKVVGLELDDNSVDWREIKRIQKIRNVVTHNDAILTDKDLIKSVDDDNYLSRESKFHNDAYVDEVNILEGYLSCVLKTFYSYCSELDTAIQAELSKT